MKKLLIDIFTSRSLTHSIARIVIFAGFFFAISYELERYGVNIPLDIHNYLLKKYNINIPLNIYNTVCALSFICEVIRGNLFYSFVGPGGKDLNNPLITPQPNNSQPISANTRPTNSEPTSASSQPVNSQSVPRRPRLPAIAPRPPLQPVIAGPGNRELNNPLEIAGSQSEGVRAHITNLQPRTINNNVNPGVFTFMSKISWTYLNSSLHAPFANNPTSFESVKANSIFLKENSIVQGNISSAHNVETKQMRGAYFFRDSLLRNNQGNEAVLRNMENESVMVDGFRVPKYTINIRNQVTLWTSSYTVLPCGIILQVHELERLNRTSFHV